MHTLRSLVFLWCFIALGSLPLMLGRVSGGIAGWGITTQGMMLSLQVMLRAICAFGSVRLLLTLIPFYELCRGLRQLGVSPLLVELLELSYRHIYILLGAAEQIRLAQLSRYGYSRGWRASYADASLLISRSFVLAHSNADRMYDGLISRGFDSVGSNAPLSLSAEQGSQRAGGTLLQLKDLSFSYCKGNDTLRGLSLSLDRGERIALLGENGAGKSTLMRILSGLLVGYIGQIELEGELLPSDRQATQILRGRIALVFQNSNHQLFCPTVEDELAFGLRNLGYEEEQVQRLTEQAIISYQLEDIRHRPPHELSEGQKKWVCLAAVLVTDPSIILLDEPTAALDRYYTSRVLNLLEELSYQGKTIILSTHDMQLVDRWAGRAWVMHCGRLTADVPIAQLWTMNSILKEANLEPPYGRRTTILQRAQEGYRLLLAHRSDQKAYIVGGGVGAMRKVRTLVEAGLECLVLAPNEPTADMQPWIDGGLLSWQIDVWRAATRLPQDVAVVVAATDKDEVNRAIVAQAMSQGLLCCSLTDPSVGNIQFVAQAGQGIRVGVHTAYQLPELAQAVRDFALDRLEGLPCLEVERLAELRRLWLETKSEDIRTQYKSLKEEIIERYLKRENQ